jgi:hypothetical protein
MLTEDKRSQLDGIVQKMTSDNESEDDIQFVVNDFKSKYDKPVQQEKSLLDATLQGLTNIPSSAYNVGKSMLQTVVKPVETGHNIAEIISGATGGSKNNGEAERQKWELFKQALKERYGGWSNIKNTLATDPVGLGMDASSLLTGGGSLAAKLPGMVGKVGTATANVGRAIEPFNVVKKGVGLIPTENVALGLYKSAIKPPAVTKKFTLAEQNEVLREGMNAGIMPTQFGIDKLQGLIDDINGSISSKIKMGSEQGLVISPNNIITRLDDLKAFYENMPDSAPYIEAIKKVENGLIYKGTFKYKKGIPLDKAQDMKTTIYTVLKKSYGELSDATKEANKNVARGLKEELVSIYPELKELNKQDSLYLKLEPMIEKAVGRIDKRDIMGIGTPIAGGAVASIAGGHAGATAMLLKAVLDHPNVKAYLAIALNKAKKGGIGKGMIDQRLQSYVAGKLTEFVNQEPLDNKQ